MLTVVAQEQKAVLAKLFNHSEKQGGTQVGFKRMGHTLQTPRESPSAGSNAAWPNVGFPASVFNLA
jgi:hypothetical protein